MKPWIFLIVIGLLLCSVVIAFQERAAFTKTEAPRLPVAVNGKLTPVIVELFTSEGCSSCPPADEVLARLEKSQPVPGAEIIALSEHVDYWNYIGWADPFSSADFSARQNEYARAFSRDGVYTPQMVVDGRAEFIGSDFSKARSAITTAAQSPKAQITITPAPNATAANSGAVSFSVRVTDIPSVSANDTVEVLLAVTENNLHSNVLRGENSGRKLNHTAVVRQLSVINNTSEQPAKTLTAESSVTIDRGWRRENLRAVVLVQERISRRVLGAAMIKLEE